MLSASTAHERRRGRSCPALTVPRLLLPGLIYQLSFDRRALSADEVPVEFELDYSQLASTTPENEGTVSWKVGSVGRYHSADDSATAYLDTGVTIAGWPAGTLVALARPNAASAWIFGDSVPSSAQECLDLYWREASNAYRARIMEDPGGGTTTLLGTAGKGAQGAWGLIGFAWGPAGWQIWLNGELIAANAAKTAGMFSTGTGQLLQLGRWYTSYGKTDFAWFGVWNRQLSLRAHQTLWNARLRLWKPS